MGIIKLDDSGRKVILRVDATGDLVTLMAGQSVEGMKVLEITPVSVRLLSPKGKIYVLKDPRALGE